MPEINIPFPGLYNSWLSSELESAEERETEHLAEQDAENWPAPLCLSANDYGDIVWRAMDYPVANERLARAYLEAFDAIAGDALGETRTAWAYSWAEKKKTRCKVNSCGMQWSTMTSPREYNFQTDRLFVTVSAAFVSRLWAMSKADNHDTLRRVLRDRFTSYDGFLSHYSNRLDDWPPAIADWDYNQLGALLSACLLISDFDEEALFWETLEGDTGYEALAAGMDWKALETRATEKRIELLTAWAETDPGGLAQWATNNPEALETLRATDFDAVAALDLPQGDAIGSFYRCPVTPDLFESRAH